MEGSEAEEGAMEELPVLIHPLRLVDADLEEYTLPPESITETFSRATANLRSRVATSFSGNIEDANDGNDNGCVQDPGLSNGQIPDKLLGATEVSLSALPLCGGEEKEAKRGRDKDNVIVIGAGDGDSARSEKRGKRVRSNHFLRWKKIDERKYLAWRRASPLADSPIPLAKASRKSVAKVRQFAVENELLSHTEDIFSVIL